MPVSASAFVKSADFDGTLAEVAAMGLPVPVSIAAMTVLVQAGGSISLITALFAPVVPPYLWFFLWRHGFWSMPPEEYLPNFAVSAANMSLIGGLIAAAILTTLQKVVLSQILGNSGAMSDARYSYPTRAENC